MVTADVDGQILNPKDLMGQLYPLNKQYSVPISASCRAEIWKEKQMSKTQVCTEGATVQWGNT